MSGKGKRYRKKVEKTKKNGPEKIGNSFYILIEIEDKLPFGGQITGIAKGNIGVIADDKRYFAQMTEE
jgi:hypothetical protein